MKAKDLLAKVAREFVNEYSTGMESLLRSVGINEDNVHRARVVKPQHEEGTQYVFLDDELVGVTQMTQRPSGWEFKFEDVRKAARRGQL